MHAELVALLTLYSKRAEVQALLEGLDEKLDLKQHMGFKKALIQQYARFGLKDEMLTSFESLQVYPSPRAVGLSLSSLLQGYASMDLPKEALVILHDMQQQGLKPSLKDYQAILFSFGKSGMFNEMEAFTLDMERLKLLTTPVAFNMILTTYGAAENHDKVRDWLEKMLAAGLKPSVRTLNAVAKACRVLMEFSSSNTFVKVGTLLERLKAQGAKVGELEVVSDLVELCLIQEVVMWEPAWQLDLHSTNAGSAYAMLCCWLEVVVEKLKTNRSFPSEIAIVTGWGKHSEIRGKSLTKLIVRDLLESVGSPFRVDSQNKGRLLAKPHAVAAWFSCL